MNINIGDKLIVKKKTNFLNEGDIVEVTDVNEHMEVVSFAFGGKNLEYKGVMSFSKCDEHFEKVVEKKEIPAPHVLEEHIEWVMTHSEFEIHTVFDKCTIVACKLPNGFVIVESSACVSPENYDEELGVSICMDKIEDKIWELEGYSLQQNLFENCCGDCCEECHVDCCDDCDDYDCKYNNNTKS